MLAAGKPYEHVGLGIRRAKEVLLKLLEERQEELEKVGIPRRKEPVEKQEEYVEGQVVDAEAGEPLLHEGLGQEPYLVEVVAQRGLEETEADVAVHGAGRRLAAPVPGEEARVVIEDCEHLQGCCGVEEQHQQAGHVAHGLLVVPKLGVREGEELDEELPARLAAVGAVGVRTEDPGAFVRQGLEVKVHAALLHAQRGEPALGVRDGLGRVSLEPPLLVELQDRCVPVLLPEVRLGQEAAARHRRCPHEGHRSHPRLAARAEASGGTGAS
mmetsp:Transcript_53753/g.149121  ORF Transcript_53753/g.149121 Transcript_53753/m.149121 type:complete len:270 (-) Transcript_53753:6-815(-)